MKRKMNVWAIAAAAAVLTALLLLTGCPNHAAGGQGGSGTNAGSIDSEFFNFTIEVFPVENLVIEGTVLKGYKDSYPRNTFFIVNVPAHITRIETNAFKDWKNLIHVDLRSCTGLQTIGARAFSGTVASIFLPSSVVTIESNAFGSDIESFCRNVFVPNDTVKDLVINSHFPSLLLLLLAVVEDGLYFSDAAKTNLVYVDYLKTGELKIPSTVKTIAGGASRLRRGLTSVDLSRCTGLETIGAFSDCTGLTSIDLSRCTGLETIGNFAFSDCKGLTSVDLSGCTRLQVIRAWAFSGCRNAEIRLPASVENIGQDAFGYIDSFYEDKRCKKVIVPNASVKNLVTGSPCNYPAERVEIRP